MTNNGSKKKESPILFNMEMVNAILSGRKTQTRRIVKGRALEWLETAGFDVKFIALPENRLCKLGYAGDRLWVRETFAIVPRTAYAQSEGVTQIIKPDDNYDAAIFRAGWERSKGGISWKPAIHMPRWACRLELEIVSVRIERLNDISEADAEAEGIEHRGDRFEVVGEECLCCEKTARDTFCNLWCHINGHESWQANPWVWVIEFKKIVA